MEFLDSLDLDYVNKKCNRVRSWYLYEQYKSLEENQLDAAMRLKDRAYQDKILKQELSERRARRRLCDQLGICRSDSKMENNLIKVPSEVPVSDNDHFESFCEINEEYELENFEDINDQDSETSKNIEDFTSVSQSREDYAESMNSVLENIRTDNFTGNIKVELENVKQDIANTINLQFDVVRENIDCLNNFTKFGDDESLPDKKEQLSSYVTSHYKFKPEWENSILAVWSRLVGFAYKFINSSHGNCYYDYSTQLFTAVLACDFLLHGINRMCKILKPYVSPISYAPSNNFEASLETYSKEKQKFSLKHNGSIKESPRNRKKYCKSMQNYNQKCCSENYWHRCGNDSFKQYLNEIKYRGLSEPLHRTKFSSIGISHSEKSYYKWMEEFKSKKIYPYIICKCRRLEEIMSNILQITRYLENLLQDITEK